MKTSSTTKRSAPRRLGKAKAAARIPLNLWYAGPSSDDLWLLRMAHALNVARNCGVAKQPLYVQGLRPEDTAQLLVGLERLAAGLDRIRDGETDVFTAFELERPRKRSKESAHSTIALDFYYRKRSVPKDAAVLLEMERDWRLTDRQIRTIVKANVDAEKQIDVAIANGVAVGMSEAKVLATFRDGLIHHRDRILKSRLFRKSTAGRK